MLDKIFLKGGFMLDKIKLALDFGFIAFLFTNPEKVITVIAGVFGIIMYLIRCVFLVIDYVKQRKKKTYTLEDVEEMIKEIYNGKNFD